MTGRLDGRRLLLTRSREDSADWARKLAAEGRITSYNVCYTKLLRQLRPPQIPLGEGTLSIDRISAINPLLGTNEAFALEALKASASYNFV